MKNYDQDEVSKGRMMLLILFVGICIITVLESNFWNIIFTMRLFIAVVFLSLCFLIWQAFCRDRGIWIWWCSTCGKEVPAKEVTHEEIHINCGCEATYKIKK